VILSLTVLSNCVSSSSNSDTAFLTDSVSVYWIGNLMRIPKQCLKLISSLQVGFTSNFVSDCQTVLKSCQNQGLEKLYGIYNTKRVFEIYDSYSDNCQEITSKLQIV